MLTARAGTADSVNGGWEVGTVPWSPRPLFEVRRCVELGKRLSA